ncbi:MAG: hypothetical protein M1820_005443 [Bogoriella megaspora]|nr:MAG: hypothetical protein M1820_005443 [Bogoriella megaspora]
MVGVPGKSKGCNTCRRRKIRCDEGKPTCTRCARSGRECEGYDRFPTFLNRTAQGLEKRKPLEEIKPRLGSPSTEPDTLSGARNRALSIPQTYSLTLAGQPHSSLSYDDQIYASFLDVFDQEAAIVASPNPRSLFKVLPTIPNPPNVLRYSTKALAASRLAFANRDSEMRMRAFDAYGRALRELQRSLYDPNAMYNDTTLAAARCLVTFELFESTSSSMRSWNSHESGTARLVQMRGPHAYQSELGARLFESVRFTSMIQSIQYRKRHFLASEEWCTVPFPNGKDHRQNLYDIGLQIGCVAEDVDRLRDTSNPVERAMLFSHSLTEFNKIDPALDAWYDALLQKNPNPLWSVPEEKLARDMTAIFFSDIENAQLITCFWSLKLLVSIIVNQMCIRFQERMGSSPPSGSPSPPSSLHPSPASPSPPQQLLALVKGMQQSHNAWHRFNLASSIVRSTPYFLRKEMGLYASHSVLMPIRIAQYELLDSRPGVDYQADDGDSQAHAPTQIPSQQDKEEVLRICTDLYDQLVTTCGIGYAREIRSRGKIWGSMPTSSSQKIEDGTTDNRDPSNSTSSSAPQPQTATSSSATAPYSSTQPPQNLRVDTSGSSRYSPGLSGEDMSENSYRIVQRQQQREIPEFTSPILERPAMVTAGWMGGSGDMAEASGGSKRPEFAYLGNLGGQ